MSTRGKKTGRGTARRGRPKAKSVVEEETESINESIEEAMDTSKEVGDGVDDATKEDSVELHSLIKDNVLDSVVSALEDADRLDREKDPPDVPELDDGPPPPTISTPIRSSVRLNSSLLVSQDKDDGETEVQEIVRKKRRKTSEPQMEEVKGEGKNGEIDESMETDEKSMGKVKNGTEENGLATEAIESDDDNSKDAEVAVEDAEMVSEDEMSFAENKEPLEDTEAVSDEELQVNQTQDLPETEAVSDDELPKEERKKAKVAEAEAVSEDELPDENEKKNKQAEAQEPESTAVEEATSEESKVEGKRKISGGEYDPSSPTSEASQDGMPPTKKQAVGDGKTPKPAAKKVLPELEKYWKAVKDDPSDFTGWTYLLQYVEQENVAEVARDAYDAFLEHYPYCYGYWRKYADFEKRKGNAEACEAVFERGLKAIPLSVDLWLHYMNYLKIAKVDDADFLRLQYERAIEACGLEFRSDRLWESYIKWETEKKNLINITNLYDRLLAIPTQSYTTHFDNFQDHVNGNPPQMILPMDDFLELRREVVQALKTYEKTVPAENKVSVPGDDAPPGEENTDTDKEDSSVSCTTRMEEETAALKGKILTARRKVYKVTVAAVAARWNFEEGIKRPYFHVKPLERCQLKNWKEYLDFEVEQNDRQRIVTLFERCLIACALYEEFWVRFVRYLETLPDDNTEKIRDVYQRACLIHHKKKPNLHLQWAVFEESKGGYDKAAAILEGMEQATPNMLQLAYRRINLERRRGNLERAGQLYEEYLEANANNKAIRTNLTVKYARFKWKIVGNIDGAISILENALESDHDNTRLYLQLIDMGLQKDPIDEDRIVAILDQFLEKEGDPDQKLMFAQRKIEFLEDFGSSIDNVHKAHEDFQKYVKQVKDKKKKSSDTSGETPTSSSTTATTPIPKVESKSSSKNATSSPSTSVPPPIAPPSSAPPPNYNQPGYPPNFYGQYPPNAAQADASSAPPYPNSNYPGYNNYPNWNNYPQGGYGNYGQPGWPGYYPNY